MSTLVSDRPLSTVSTAVGLVLGVSSGTTLYALEATHPVFRSVQRWDDLNHVHRSVMSLFPAELPGASHERRAGSGILFRVETESAAGTRVLVQSQVPILPTTGVRSVGLDAVLDRLTAGQAIRFRLAANPVRQCAEPFSPRYGQRVPLRYEETDDGVTDELTPWLIGKFAGGLTNVQLRIAPQIAMMRAGRAPLHIVTFNGIAMIDDPVTLRRLIETGVGRAKAYGCGLLSVA